MTREEIEAAYTVKDGRITSPGKFEGEAVYVPYFWAAYLDGFADRDDGRVLGFDIVPDDRKRFPELGRKQTVRLIQDDSGFVREV